MFICPSGFFCGLWFWVFLLTFTLVSAAFTGCPEKVMITGQDPQLHSVSLRGEEQTLFRNFCGTGPFWQVLSSANHCPIPHLWSLAAGPAGSSQGLEQPEPKFVSIPSLLVMTWPSESIDHLCHSQGKLGEARGRGNPLRVGRRAWHRVSRPRTAAQRRRRELLIVLLWSRAVSYNISFWGMASGLCSSSCLYVWWKEVGAGGHLGSWLQHGVLTSLAAAHA